VVVVSHDQQLLEAIDLTHRWLVHRGEVTVEVL
jgi:ATPase subunit of ABC transporter with duplicated ATPase domains